MEILKGFDLTASYRDAAELAGCSPNTVARYVACREAGTLMPGRAERRPSVIDGFLPKLEELVERSQGKIRADVAHDKIVAMGFAGSERTTRRAVAEIKKAWRSGRRRVHRPVRSARGALTGKHPSERRHADRVALAVEADHAVGAAEHLQRRLVRRRRRVQQRKLGHGVVPQLEPIAAQCPQWISRHVAVHQELAPGERVLLRGCADQLGGVRAHRQPTEPVGQGLLGSGRHGGHHSFRIYRTTGAVHVPGRQDVHRAHGQQPVQIAQTREVRSCRLRTVGADVRHAQPVLHTFSDEVHQATAVVRHVTVRQHAWAPDARTPSGAGANGRIRRGYTRPHAPQPGLDRFVAASQGRHPPSVSATGAWQTTATRSERRGGPGRLIRGRSVVLVQVGVLRGARRPVRRRDRHPGAR